MHLPFFFLIYLAVSNSLVFTNRVTVPPCGLALSSLYLLCPLSSEFHSSYTILEIPEDGRVRGRENEKVEKSASSCERC